MGVWALWWHVVNFGLPAVVVSALLATAAVGGPWKPTAASRWFKAWLLLCALGWAVLLAGLWWFGRDGKLFTYGAFVLAMGTASYRLSRRR
jgi:hypothetical protein